MESFWQQQHLLHPIQPFEAMQSCGLMKKPLYLKVQTDRTRDVKTWQQTKFPGSRAAEIELPNNTIG